MSVVTADRSRVVGSIRPYAGILAVGAAMFAFGFAVEWWLGDLTTVLAPYRLFFQLSLAGIVLCLLQNEVGLRTYGLFAPMIIAFILVVAGPIWGLALFLNVFLVTFMVSTSLSSLDVATGPRVATLLTVACLMTVGTLLLGDLGALPPLFDGMGVTFPVVISAWYAERMATDVRERGWTTPAVNLLWTVVAICLAYALVVSPLVEWFMGTPIAWVGAIGGLLYVSSRPTLRLSEYLRFDTHVADGPFTATLVAVRVWLHNAWAAVAGVFGRSVERWSTTDVLAMKVRNQYIDEYNPEHARPAADRKATLKKRLSDLGIGAPETYLVVREPSALADARAAIAARGEFVVKPSQGYGGEGVLISTGRIEDRDETVFETNKGALTEDEVLGHVRRILEGDYAGLEPEGQAIIEERLRPAERFRELSGGGVPDVRVLVFQGYPVMTMTRLPTAESGGTANLHLGGIGVGLDLTDGTPLDAYQQTTDRWLTNHPDTGADLTAFRVPNWESVLRVAVRATAATGLGYAGVDIVLDDTETPRVLEVNGWPGLGIQQTTGDGIRDRLAFVEALPPGYEFLGPSMKVALARYWNAKGWDVSVHRDPSVVLADMPPAFAGVTDNRTTETGREVSRASR